MANILIQGMELPKNADEHITIGYNRLGELTAVKVVWNGMSWTVVEESKAVLACGQVADVEKAHRSFSGLSECYEIALRDCDLEKEVYPHYGALMRGKKAVMELADKLLAAAVVKVTK